MRDPLVLFLLLTGAVVTGQQGMQQVMVLDSMTGAAVAGVHVVAPDGRVQATTDSTGRCTLSWGEEAHRTLTFSHVAYVGRTLVRERSTDPLVVQLLPALHMLPAAVVPSPGPELVHQLAGLHISTFRITSDGLWVLGYARLRMLRPQELAGVTIMREALLVVLDTAFVELARIPVPGEAMTLHRGYAGQILLETRSAAHACAYDNGRIELVAFELNALREAVLPWTDSIPGWLLGHDATGMYPAFTHFAYDPAGDRTRTICEVVDRPLMELFRSQYKYMSGHDKVVAMDLADQLGMDKQTVAGYMTGFHRDLYFRAPYAPLFVVGDTLCVFDHYRERIRLFGLDLSALDEVPISYQYDRHWRTRLVQDARNGQVYALFARGPRTWLRRVDTRTGALGAMTTLFHPYPEEVQVYDGRAYYVHRATGSTGVKALYREVLR